MMEYYIEAVCTYQDLNVRLEWSLEFLVVERENFRSDLPMNVYTMYCSSFCTRLGVSKKRAHEAVVFKLIITNAE
jgi:hypothetical protein